MNNTQLQCYYKVAECLECSDGKHYCTQDVLQSIRSEQSRLYKYHSLILSLLIKLDFVPWMLILILYMYHSILNRINWSKLTNLKIHAFQQVLRIRRKNRKQWLFLALNNLINCYSAAYYMYIISKRFKQYIKVHPPLKKRDNFHREWKTWSFFKKNKIKRFNFVK